ncbi:hypothetical protein K504DRAFT_48904 [Pleomassaria siparia CBS 279.74]|uniref:Cupredoxin n=1 Tax=Pleomassaria siparia CBS 279.74 TaxID=1314801 RepID=A0A6G1K3C5_9PLEO|nr:hypothetical protein K504DRAFT_48904 [Pleomassaria siparia CBS 279.74]
MKYIAALSMAISLAAGQMMPVMSAAPAAPGATVHMVTVGGVKAANDGSMVPVLGYFPEAITANVGDVVQFNFMQKNHTATQSTFAEPCVKMEGGLDSGFMPNPDGKAGVTWNVTVKSTDPMWFYCKQKVGVHCGVGMVFSINASPAGDKTMASFKQLAININGTSAKPLVNSPIQNVQPNAQAAPSTVTIAAGGGVAAGSAASTGAGGAAPPSATVAAGEGVNPQGQACSCSCLCGMNDFPAVAAVNNFGGFAGTLG